MKRSLLLIAVFLGLTVRLTGADPAPAMTATEFLKQSMSRYQALKSFQVQCAWREAIGRMTSTKAAGQETDTRTFVYAAPNKFKVVSSRTGFVQTSVSDGVHVAEYTSMASLPAQTYPAPGTIAAVATMQMQHPMFCGTLLYKFFGGPSGLKSLAQTAKEPVSFGPDVVVGGEPCRTVRFYGTGLYGHAQVAISRRDLLVRRIRYDSAPLLAMMRQMKRTPAPTGAVTTETYSHLVTDQDVSANVFDVTVPTGMTATDMAGADAPQPPVKIGQLAPDFSVAALGGGQMVRLSSLRGRVVLLDFWATWCPPCRRGLPETQALSARYGGKGLAVLAISLEPPATVAHFVKTNHYTFPAYHDTMDGANKTYKINAIPTVAVIDATGHLSAFFVGLQDPETIKAALAKAGLPVN